MNTVYTGREKQSSAGPRTDKSDKPAQWTPCRRGSRWRPSQTENISGHWTNYYNFVYDNDLYLIGIRVINSATCQTSCSLAKVNYDILFVKGKSKRTRIETVHEWCAKLLHASHKSDLNTIQRETPLTASQLFQKGASTVHLQTGLVIIRY
jgi:hypothetical protein